MFLSACGRIVVSICVYMYILRNPKMKVLQNIR